MTRAALDQWMYLDDPTTFKTRKLLFGVACFMCHSHDIVERHVVDGDTEVKSFYKRSEVLGKK